MNGKKLDFRQVCAILPNTPQARLTRPASDDEQEFMKNFMFLSLIGSGTINEIGKILISILEKKLEFPDFIKEENL